jgi:hypothetical protein
MRWRFAASALIAAVTSLSACTGSPSTVATHDTPPEFSVRRLPPSPSPLRLEVQSGEVEALVPADWDVQPISRARYPQEGFVASPQLSKWERGAGVVRGMEAFWVDITRLRIPSDYYYLVARGPAVSSLAGNKNCHPTGEQVLADHPPELTGRHFSPGDYVISAKGTCHSQGQATSWAYIVAAPGFGPVREVGLPSSGLYVVLAVVSGRRADALLQQMLQAARFGNVPITQIVAVARTNT